MTEQLPINIEVSKPLTVLYPKIVGISNKLEAQFNFQTMTANWYGDENNIITIKLFLESSSSFTHQLVPGFAFHAMATSERESCGSVCGAMTAYPARLFSGALEPACSSALTINARRWTV